MQNNKESKDLKLPKGTNEVTAELASLIKNALNKGGRCGDIAAAFGVTYAVVYGIFKEYAWKEIEPLLVRKHVARVYTKRRDKHISEASTAGMSPLLIAWGFAPKK